MALMRLRQRARRVSAFIPAVKAADIATLSKYKEGTTHPTRETGS